MISSIFQEDEGAPGFALFLYCVTANSYVQIQGKRKVPSVFVLVFDDLELKISQIYCSSKLAVIV